MRKEYEKDDLILGVIVLFSITLFLIQVLLDCVEIVTGKGLLD